MSQSFVKKPDNGPHSALAGLGVLSAERQPADPVDVLRRIVAWRDSVHAGRIVRGAELEALIEEGRAALGVSASDSQTCPGIPASSALDSSASGEIAHQVVSTSSVPTAVHRADGGENAPRDGGSANG